MNTRRTRAPQRSLEICILAGGLGTRMGRDKSRVRFGSKTMLALIRDTARTTGLPVRVIRRDLVPRCGPLGGILTALKTTSARAILFLACDMPFISLRLLARFRPPKTKSGGLFAATGRGVGFPFLLSRDALQIVQQQIECGEYSLQNLAKALGAAKLALPARWSFQLVNVNTPERLQQARHMLLERTTSD